MCSASDTPSEARAIIGEMVSQVKTLDAPFFDRFETEPLEELPEWKSIPQNPNAGESFAREFDVKLYGKTSRLVDYSPNALGVIAESFQPVPRIASAHGSASYSRDRHLNPHRILA